MIGIQVQIIGDREIQAQFVKLGNDVSEPSWILEPIGEKALGDFQKHIDNHPGPPLAESTVKRKGHTRILRDKDDLYNSFEKGSDNNVFRVSALEVEVGTRDPKAMFHQEGTARMPRRTIIEKPSGEQLARYTKIGGDVLRERMRQIGFEVV